MGRATVLWLVGRKHCVYAARRRVWAQQVLRDTVGLDGEERSGKVTRNSVATLRGVAYNGSDGVDTVYMAREDGCACRFMERDTAVVDSLRYSHELREQTW